MEKNGTDQVGRPAHEALIEDVLGDGVSRRSGRKGDIRDGCTVDHIRSLDALNIRQGLPFIVQGEVLESPGVVPGDDVAARNFPPVVEKPARQS